MTALYTSAGDGPTGTAVVETLRGGAIEFGLLGGNVTTATVTRDGQERLPCAARQQSRPFPCSDAS